MSEGGLLQRLMAEQHGQSPKSAEISKANGSQEAAGLRQSLGNSPYSRYRQQTVDTQQQQNIERMSNINGRTTPRRALSDDSPVLSQRHPFLKSSSRSAEVASLQQKPDSVGNSGQPPTKAGIVPDSTSFELISRLRQEILSKPTRSASQTPLRSYQPTPVVSAVNSSGVTRVATPIPAGNNMTNFPSSASSKLQLNGHPKSNSAGEEFLYTDRKAQLAASKNGRRHHRGKSSAVVRSRSLHYKNDYCPPSIVERRAGTDLGLTSEIFASPNIAPATSVPRKKSDTSSLSSGSYVSDNKSQSSSSYKADNYFQVTVDENSNQAAHNLDTSNILSESSSSAWSRNKQLQNSMVVTPPGIGNHPKQSMTQAGPHGPFYATVPTNPIGHLPIQPHRHSPPPQHHQQSHQQTSNLSVQIPTSSPRGPPPPYPQGTGMPELQPQRPNSLPLSGQLSRKKQEYGSTQNTSALTSPAISSQNHQSFSFSMTAGTPVRGTSFFAFPNEPQSSTTTTTMIGSNGSSLRGYSSAGMQAHQPQFSRKGSGGMHEAGFQQIPQTQQADQLYNSNVANPVITCSPSPVTAATVTYQQQQYENVMMFETTVPMLAQQQHQVSNTPVHLQQQQHQQHQQQATSPIYNKHFTQQPQQQANTQSFYDYSPNNMTNYSNNGNPGAAGYSLGKSDSVNSNTSTTSSGSRIARRAKRNSKNFSNTSGSSSSTGNSRPNSSSDLMERVMNENEILRAQLQSTNQKMKKFQNIEKDFLRITEEYKSLQSLVSKSEKMERDLRTQLESTNRRTQQENEILRERISTLTELVETLQSSNKDTQTPNSDIMTYKVKVKELQSKERLLTEQLDEYNMKISEQQADFKLLTTYLEKTQATNASLKEKLLEKQKTDRYVEELEPLLESLSRTIKARLHVESELENMAKLHERRSTSSNDEGISEMDSGDIAHVHSLSFSGTSTQPTDLSTNRDEVICAQGQMLKWQHIYVQAILLRELSATSQSDNGDSTSSLAVGSAAPLYQMLHSHRHAASDPSFNKIQGVAGLPSWDASSLRTLIHPETSRSNKPHEKQTTQVKLRSPLQRRDKSGSDLSRTSPRRRRRETTSSLTSPITSPNNAEFEGDQRLQDKNTNDFSNDSLDAKSEVAGGEQGENQCSNTPDGSSQLPALETENSNVSPISNEVDSPSEGYHSQQSSGSPTPSSERSSLHFPEGDPRVTAALAPLQDAPCSATTTNSRIQVTSSCNTGLFILGAGSGREQTVLTKVADV